LQSKIIYPVDGMAIVTHPYRVIQRSSETVGLDSPVAKQAWEFQDRPLARRLASGISRRARYWTQRLRGRSRYDHAERALRWLLDNAEQILDERSTSSKAIAASSLIHHMVGVLERYGQQTAVQEWSRRLHGLSRESDSLASSAKTTPSRTPLPKSKWSRNDSFQLARSAVRIYRQGDRATADAVMRQLRRRQREDGSFGVARSSDEPSAREATLSAVLYFLEAAQLQVFATFAGGADPVYQEIAPSDPRAKAVSAWFVALGADRNIVDVGCGSGRFPRMLARCGEPCRLTGVDPSAESLAKLPEYVHARQGDFLSIPAADGEFDGAFAVESLEHALIPRMAIDELCRVVRPGGRVLVIDKHASLQPLSRHAPWERWFQAAEVCQWLAMHCDEVSVSPLLHRSDRMGRTTFLAWHGRRRMVAFQRPESTMQRD